jgi:hypothetical protein
MLRFASEGDAECITQSKSLRTRKFERNSPKGGLLAAAAAVAIFNDNAAVFFGRCDLCLLLDSAISIALKYMRAFLCDFPQARMFGFAIAFTKDGEWPQK